MKKVEKIVPSEISVEKIEEKSEAVIAVWFELRQTKYEMLLKEENKRYAPYSIRQPIGVGSKKRCSFCEDPYMNDCLALAKEIGELFGKVRSTNNYGKIARTKPKYLRIRLMV